MNHFFQVTHRDGECWIDHREVALVEDIEPKGGCGTLILLSSGDERVVKEPVAEVLNRMFSAGN
jgi:uncharacterized protein YlzI (FlbEa/FlbD family)